MFGINNNRLHGHLAMARISNSPTVVTNVLAGAVIAGAFNTGNLQAIILLSIALIAFYTAGMYLNDLCDYEIDLKERSERPLVTGIVSKNEAWIVTIALFALGLGLLLTIKASLLISGMILIGLIVLYDVWHKGNIVSPVIMGANRFMVYVIAYLAFMPSLSFGVLIPAGLLWGYILGVTLIAKSENTGNFTQYSPMLVLLAPAIYALSGLSSIVFVMIIAFVIWVIYSATFIYQHNKIKNAIGFLLAGICLLDGLLLASLAGWVGALLAISGFALTLYLQQYVKGT